MKKQISMLKKYEELKYAFTRYDWDGDWFFRATKDNGGKIGSMENEEGKIYLNPQIWSVISDIEEKEKQDKALYAVESFLLKKMGLCFFFHLTLDQILLSVILPICSRTQEKWWSIYSCSHMVNWGLF